MKLKKLLQFKRIYFYGNSILENDEYKQAELLTEIESAKKPLRFDVINLLISKSKNENPIYLEIGVRNPIENFDKINCKTKYSVDPGIEFDENPVDFKLTSDNFFTELRKGKVLTQDIKFDVIFIDGLHLADQVERDIQNSLEFIKEDGFIVLHDCNPSTEFHAREKHNFRISPAWSTWNGTVWKALYKTRLNKNLSTCCIDSDCGIGIISKIKLFDSLEKDFNPFFEFHIFENNRTESLNLISFEEFKKKI